MKVIKLATALLIGCSAFNPLIALSQSLVENNQITFFMDGKNYSCFKAETTGNYFKFGINGLCDRAGYKRQLNYEPTNWEIAENRRTLAESVNKVRNLCLEIRELKKTTDDEIILGCAEAGVDVNENWEN